MIQNKYLFFGIIFVSIVFLVSGCGKKITIISPPATEPSERTPIEQYKKYDPINSPFGLQPAAILPPERASEFGLQNHYDFAFDLGAKWDRAYFIKWQSVQPDLSKSEYDWSDIDPFIQMFPKNLNLMVNLFIGGIEPWELDDLNHDYYKYAEYRSYLPKGDKVEDYLNFVKATVERYDGDGIDDMPGLSSPIRYWQVENEPPMGRSGYGKFYQITYDTIKDADPKAKVVFAGIAGTASAYRVSEESLDYFGFYDRAIKESFLLDEVDEIDVFDIHWAGRANSKDNLEIKDVLNYWKNKLSERGIAPKYGYWITEMSTYSGDPDEIKEMDYADFSYQSEKEQAIDVIRRYVYPLSIGIKKIFWEIFVEGFKNDKSYYDFTGFVYDGKFDYDQGKGIKKLSYYTYKKMIEILEGSNWDEIEITQESNGIYIYKFNKEGKSIWVAWNDNSDIKPISVSLRQNISRNKLKIIQAIPNYDFGKNVIDYKTAFKEIDFEMLQKDDLSQINFKLDDIPVFVIEK